MLTVMRAIIHGQSVIVVLYFFSIFKFLVINLFDKPQSIMGILKRSAPKSLRLKSKGKTTIYTPTVLKICQYL